MKSTDFKKKPGTSRFINLLTNQEISRRQRDKLLGVGEYRPKGWVKPPVLFSKVKGTSKYRNNKTGEITSKYKAAKERVGAEVFLKKERERKARYKNGDYPYPLKPGQLLSISKTIGESWDNQQRVDFGLFGFEHEKEVRKNFPRAYSIKHFLIFIQTAKSMGMAKKGRRDELAKRLKEFEKAHGKKFEDFEDYEQFIADLLEAIGYADPDFNRYV